MGDVNLRSHLYYLKLEFTVIIASGCADMMLNKNTILLWGEQMADVFISYSIKDEQFANLVHGHLLSQGLDVFLAAISLKVGEHWTPQIVEALRGAEWVFFLASKNALDSVNVQQEVGGAIFNKKKLVPIMWDLLPSELPRWVSDYQGLVLTGETMESIDLQVSKLAATVKASKLKAQLVAAAVFAVGLWAMSQ